MKLKKQKNKKNHQVGILELKSTITEIKKITKALNGRYELAEENN